MTWRRFAAALMVVGAAQGCREKSPPQPNDKPVAVTAPVSPSGSASAIATEAATSTASAAASASSVTPPVAKPGGLDQDGIPTVGIVLTGAGLTADIDAPALPAISIDGTRVVMVIDIRSTEGAVDLHFLVLDTEKDRIEHDTQLLSPAECEQLADGKLARPVVESRILGRIKAARGGLAKRTWQPMSACRIELPDGQKLELNEPQTCSVGDLDVHYQRPQLKINRARGASATKTLLDRSVPGWQLTPPAGAGCTFHAVIEGAWLDSDRGVLVASILNAYATPDGCHSPTKVHALRFPP
jgi:hypothetical protein